MNFLTDPQGQKYRLRIMRHHRRFRQRGKQSHQCRNAFRRARRQAHHAEQGQKTGYGVAIWFSLPGIPSPMSPSRQREMPYRTCFKRRRVTYLRQMR